MVLEVKNLRTSFKTQNGLLNAVNGVSFSIDAGKTLGIVGESGCGKSITSLSIMQLLPGRTSVIEKGSSIKLDGEELVGKAPREMYKIRGKKISMIFQDSMTSLNPVMTIGSQLTECFRIHQKISKKEAREAAINILKNVEIPSPESRMKDYPHQLSGGMRQRIMIAMALVSKPEVIIADEPTTALDVTIQAQILKLMKELQETTNTAIILITHDMGVVAHMADDIVVMYAGQVVEHADTLSLFKNPLHPYTKGLLNSIPRTDQNVDKLYSIKGMVPNLQNMPNGCRFHDRCEKATDLCMTESPKLYSIGDRCVRCHLYKEEGKACE